MNYRNLRQLKIMKSRIEATKQCSKGRKVDPAYYLSRPSTIGIKLTNRCNLRCKHCFEWSSTGYHHKMDKECQNGDVSLDIIKEVLDFTEDTKAALYLWGGEPTIYKDWETLCDLIIAYDRDVVICTNGINIVHLEESLCRLGERITLLFSIEGFEEEHDKIRGKGTYSKTINALNFYAKLQEQGKYTGFLSIETVVSDDLIPNLEDYCRSFQKQRIDVLYLNLPWFINPRVAKDMDNFFENNIKSLCIAPSKLSHSSYSWHSFDFKISDEKIKDLLSTLELVLNNSSIGTKIQLNPNISPQELSEYLKGEDIFKSSTELCLSYSQRIDILPNGDVCPCKKFPEITIGNLHSTPIEILWSNGNFPEFRRALNNRLMPICSKCELFYAHRDTSNEATE